MNTYTPSFEKTYTKIAYIQNITGPLNGLTLPQAGSSYGDYLYWNGTGAYISGSSEIKIGSNAGQIEQGIGSIAIGYQAGQTNQSTGGGFAVAIGYLAGSDNQCISAVSIGLFSGQTNQQDNCISIGNCAGQIDQGITADPIKGQAVAIGYKSAQFQQGDKSISIGDHSGQNQQHDLSIAIGSYAGNLQQSTGSIAIGQNAGYTNLGQYSIAIGNNACQNTGVDNSIVLNAQTTALDATQSGFYVNPVRTFDGTESNFLTYTNNEITQDTNFTYVQSQTGYVINGNLNPYSGAYYNLGTVEKPWKSIYVSTGSVFIGPTGTLQINSNGLIASDVGLAGPIIQVGSTNPGNGIILYNNNNILYYQNQSGSTGPVSIFQQANNGGLNVYYTGGNIGIGTNLPTSSLDVHGSCHITDKLILGNNNTGSIYFEKENQTGCFIDTLRFNGTGNNYVFYNNFTKELVQATPLYFYSYSTGTQIFTGTNIYFPVRFDANVILNEDWHHRPGDSSFTGSFNTNAIIELSYNIQAHSTAGTTRFIAAALYLDGSPIIGSYRSASVVGSNGEYTLSNSILVNCSSGEHIIYLGAAVDDLGVNIGGVPTIAPPSGTYTAVNFRCTRIL